MDERTISTLLTLFTCALRKSPPELPARPDWDALFPILIHNHMLPLVSECILSLPDAVGLPAGQKEALWNDSLRAVYQQNRRDAALTALLEDAAAQNLHPILLKGLSLSRLYPEPGLRTSCDADIYASQAEMPPLRALFEAHGLTLAIPAGQWQREVEEWHLGDVLVIELHHQLAYHAADGAYQILLEAGLMDANRAVTLPGTKICVPRPEAHLLYMIYHFIKHIASASTSLHFLADIALFMRAHLDEIDFPALNGALRRMGYDAFAASLFMLLAERFDVPESALAGLPAPSKDAMRALLADCVTCADPAVKAARTYLPVQMSPLLRASGKPFPRLRYVALALFTRSAPPADASARAAERRGLLPNADVLRWLAGCGFSLMMRRISLLQTLKLLR